MDRSVTVMSEDELAELLAERLPPSTHRKLAIEQVNEWSIRVRMAVSKQNLGPGATISGATMMGLADVAMYLMTLAQTGPVEPMAATNLNISFLSAPGQGDLIAMGQLLKLGEGLAVGEVGVYADGDTRPAAHATVTYSIPP